MFKIALLGANGQLGQEIKDLLVEYPEFHFEAFTENDCDITKEQDLFYTIESSDFTHIINCAAYTNVAAAETDKKAAFAVNDEGVKSISNICRKKQIKLIHISTDYVFDGEKGSPYFEMDQTNPINEYGKSKLAGEQHVKNLGQNGLIIRTASLYSSGNTNFVYSILDKVKRKEGLKVVCDQFCSPTFVNDLAFAIVNNILDKPIHGILNVVNEGEVSWFDFAKKITELAGHENYPMIKVKLDDFKSVVHRPKYSVLSIKKLKTISNITMRTWDKAIEQFMFQINGGY